MGTFHADLTGKRFGRLTVKEYDGDSKWFCRCDCGKGISAVTAHLNNGHTQSCGCFLREKKTTHGQSNTLLHRVWCAMRDRCNNPNNKAYHNYGGRGIRVCERWDSFALFASDMGPMPMPKMQVNRVGNDGNYEPGNCEWSTAKHNLNNKRTNRPVTLSGRTQNLSQWAEELGMHNATLTNRLNRGWTVEQALTEPVNKKE